MGKWGLFIAIALASISTIFSGACTQPPTPTVTYTLPELKYLLLAHFDNVFYVDPDFYPVAREGQEEKNALEQFPIIKSDSAEFQAILKQLGLTDRPEYTDAEKLLIYREHKKLIRGVELTTSGKDYRFVIRVGESQGERIEGTITPYGKITITKREPSFNTHPICLMKGTLIDTPVGQVPVEQIQKGMHVWTVDGTGKRVSAAVVKISQTPVPAYFQVVRVSLSDGRSVTASPGHPSAEGGALGGYKTGDRLDGAMVSAIERVLYNEDETYDLLPDSTTCLYWANGILLKSTLPAN